MIKFDLWETPPSVEDIEVEKRSLNAERARLKRRMLVIICGINLAELLVVSLLWRIGYFLSGKYIAIIAVFAVFLTVICVVVKNIFDKRVSELDCRLDKLSYINDESYKYHLIDTLTACNNNPDCESYRKSVVETGRPLTIAEGTMLKKWGSLDNRGLTKAQLHRQQEAACAVLTGVNMEVNTYECGKHRR